MFYRMCLKVFPPNIISIDWRKSTFATDLAIIRRFWLLNNWGFVLNTTSSNLVL